MTELDLHSSVHDRSSCLHPRNGFVALAWAADRLHTTRRAIFRLRQSGALVTRSVRGRGPGGGRQVSIASLIALIEEGTVVPPEKEAIMPAGELPVLHPFEEVAETYGISVRSLKDAAYALKFEHVQIGRRRYFTAAQLAAYLAANTQAQPTSLTDPALEAARAQRDKTERRRKKTPSTPGVTG